MQPPRFSPNHPDYCLECEQALEPALIFAIDQARAVGWKRGVIWQFLLSVITNLELAEIENERTDREIARASLEVR